MKYILLSIGLFIGVVVNAQEVCDNGRDDDGDGLVDLNDPDCACDGANIFVPASLFPNPSFEILDHPGCSEGPAQAGCAAGWISPSNLGTPDYGRGCNGPISVFLPDPPCPIPDGEYYFGIADIPSFIASDGSTGILKEYIGTYLNAPLVAGQTYVLSFWIGYVSSTDNNWSSSPSNFAVFGNTSTAAMPFLGRNCPTVATQDLSGNPIVPWREITTVQLTNEDGIWKQYEVEFSPTQAYTSVLLGPSCDVAQDTNYYFFDNIVLSRKDSFSTDFISDNGGNPCSGTLELSVPTDVPNLDYQWYKDGIALAGATSASYEVEPLPDGGGDYTCLVSNGLGCSSSDSYSVTSPSSPPQIIAPAGICDGDTLEIAVAADYSTYTWSHTATNAPSAHITSSGAYHVTVTDISGCTYEDSVTVGDYADVGFSTDVQPESDTMAADGSITITTSNTLTGVSITWEDGITDNPRLGLGAGTYCFVIDADSFCPVSSCLEVPIAIQPLTVRAETTPVRCSGEQNASIAVHVGGGAPPLTWTWSIEAPDNSARLDDLGPGDYTLTVTDALGSSIQETFTIDPVTPIIAEVDLQRPSCFSLADGQVRVLSVSGGHGDYSFQWDGGPSSGMRSLSDLSGGAVMLTVMDGEGCAWERQFFLETPAPISATIDIEHAICASVSDGAIYVEDIQGGTPDYDIFLDGTPASASNTELMGNQSYIVTVQDAQNCIFRQEVYLYEEAEFDVHIAGPDSVERYKEFLLSASTSDAAIQYTWSTSAGEETTCTNCPNYTAFAEEDMTIYLLVESIDGCLAADTFQMRTSKSKRVYIPTAFSPNEDGVNDDLVFFNTDAVRMVHDFQVFNAQGNIVFHGKNGTLPSTLDAFNQRVEDRALPGGIYIYTVQLLFEDNTTELIRGEFVIVR